MINVHAGCLTCTLPHPHLRSHPRATPTRYAESKALGEIAVREACCDSLMTVAIAPHQVYGPRDKLFVLNFLKAAKGGLLRVFACKRTGYVSACTQPAPRMLECAWFVKHLVCWGTCSSSVFRLLLLYLRVPLPCVRGGFRCHAMVAVWLRCGCGVAAVVVMADHLI